jgi:antigen flippase
MKLSEKQIAIGTQQVGSEPVWEHLESENQGLAQTLSSHLLAGSEFRNVIATFLTTLAIFGIFLVQGIIVARILLPEGRGEFGTAMFFPRDVFLYAGLFGGIEIVNSYAVAGFINIRSLKYSAAKVGMISGTVTAVLAGIVSVIVMLLVGKTYLIPYCLLCCLFVPFEHIQLTISAVDRGSQRFRFYNVNRLLYALTFLVLIVVVFGLKINTLIGLSPLLLICGLFVLSRIIGIAPTLRGMHVWQSWTGHPSDFAKRDDSELDQPNDSSTVATDIEVPSAWTLLKNGRFYALSMLASETFEKLDMFLIVAIATVTESGFYFVAVPAAQLLIIAPNALGVFTFNAGADKRRRITLRKVITVMAGTAVLQTISAVILSMLIPFLIVLFYKSDFEPAIPFALWLLPACAIKGYLQAVDGYLKGRGKPMIGVWARFLSIFVMLAFVGAVYADLIPGPQQKLLSIPMSACLGQAISMVIISFAVIFDTIEREREFESVAEEVENVSH